MSWIIIATFFLLLAGHSFTTYPLTLLVVRRLTSHDREEKIREAETEVSGSIAVCISVYNEEKVICEKINNVLSIRARTNMAIEVLVYADACTDNTVALLRSFGEAITLVEGKERGGKSQGMNSLVGRTNADIIVFTDANVLFDSNALKNLHKYFMDPSIGCVCGHLRYTNKTESDTAQIGAKYWQFEEWLKELETDTGSTMGADGSIFAIRREFFKPVPVDIIDDMYTSLSILCDGRRVIRAVDVVAYEKGAVGSKEEFSRKVRISCRAFNCHRKLWPRLRHLDAWNLYKYVSHKLLRWFTAYFLLGAAIGLFGAVITWHVTLPFLSACAAVVLAVSVGRWSRVKVAVRVVEVLSAFLATGVGIWRSVEGERFQTWNPVSSAR